jgi:hypothetical protein
VDLSALGAGQESFTPYLVERNAIWIGLPLVSLFFLLLHLKNPESEPSKRKEKS